MSKFVGILKIVGASFLIGLGSMSGISGGILTWQGVENEQSAKEIFMQTEEYIEKQAREDERMGIIKDRFDEIEQKYYKGELSTEEYKEEKEKYDKERNYSENEFFEELLNSTENEEIRDLLKKSKLEKGFGIGLCALSGITLLGKAITTSVQNIFGDWQYDDGSPWTFTTGGYLVDVIKDSAKEIRKEVVGQREEKATVKKQIAQEIIEQESVNSGEKELKSIEEEYYR